MDADGIGLGSLPCSLPGLLDRRAGEEPDRELVRFGGGRTVRIAELAEVSRRLAARLVGLAGPGEGVLTCLAPGPRALEVMFGLARTGRVEVPVAADAAPAAVAVLCERAAVRASVIDADLVARRPDLVAVLAAAGPVVVGEGTSHLHLDELPAGAVEGAAPGPGDPLVVMSTSGTTGRSKAAVLPHRAALRQAARVSTAMAYGRDDVLLNVFPWHHVNARHAGLLPALLTGAVLVVRPRFSASVFWRDCRDEGVTAFNFMGAMLAILDRRPPSPGDRDHRVRRAYGAPAPPDLAERVAARFGVVALEAYACTELADLAVSSLGNRRPGTAGPVVPEYEVAVLDDDGRRLPPGRVGRLVARPRLDHIAFLGYAGDPEATAATVVDGWFHTGDRARLDPDGHLVFAGRRADVVRRRGENVSTWEVEQVVRTMPGVQDVAAVGVAAELTEQELLVVVEAGPGTVPSEPDVHAWCAARLPRPAVPRYVQVVPSLPRTPTGKVAKADLAGSGLVAGTWDAEHV